MEKTAGKQAWPLVLTRMMLRTNYALACCFPCHGGEMAGLSAPPFAFPLSCMLLSELQVCPTYVMQLFFFARLARKHGGAHARISPSLVA